MAVIRLIDETMGASYIDRYLHFEVENISHYTTDLNRTMLSGKIYPDTACIYIKGSELQYKVRLEDLSRIVKIE